MILCHDRDLAAWHSAWIDQLVTAHEGNES